MSCSGNNANVQCRTGEACESTGMIVCVCFHGVCGGGVDRGVICPAALQRPNGRCPTEAS